MAIKQLKMVADLETTTDPNDLPVRVWAACAVEIGSLETLFLGNNLDDFMKFLEPHNSTCYFHNEKFDGEFILSWLFRNGYKYSATPKTKTFSCTITDNGIWYALTVIFQKKNKKYQKVTFYDSLKKLPFKVATIAKAFELQDEKGEIDYDAPRPVGHVLTPEEEKYIVKDCRIVAEALTIQLGKGLTKMTNAGDAMAGYKSIMGKKQFEHTFPVLPVELDADIRRAYKGGYVYLKEIWVGMRGLRGITLDVNSLYPWVMRHCLLPYGYPMYFEGKPEPNEAYPLYIVRIKCAFDLKPDHLPTIQLKNNPSYMQTEYLTTSNGGIEELTLTSVDLALFLDHYDVEGLEYVNGWRFKAKYGLFDEYIDYWMHIKETTTGAMRQLAKLMLNSLYGRFAMNPKAFNKFPVMDEDGVVKYVVWTKENAEKYPWIPEPELRDPVYTAMGAFITAYARNKTIRAGQACYDRTIYMDTDSLHLIGTEIPEGIDVHPTRLGAWKMEGEFVDSKFIRAKTYMESVITIDVDTLKTYARLLNKLDTLELLERHDDGIHWVKNKVTCAGMPDNIKEVVTYENFHKGSTFDGKLMPKRFQGGIILMPTTFTIK